MSNHLSPERQPAQIADNLRRIVAPGEIFEVRILGTTRGTVSGYFDSIEVAAQAAARYDGRHTVYITLNPVNTALLARAANRLVEYARHTTSDADITHRRWLPIDCDPVRPSGISATDAEKAAAIERICTIRRLLTDVFGWPAPILADSGNGAHLLFRVDLPNDPATRTLVEACLKTLSLRFSDDSVSVDEAVHNAARIWKLYGTLACKGDSTPDRPHRRASILEGPDSLEIVSREHLERLAATLPEPDAASATVVRASGASDPFDVEERLARWAVLIKRSKSWNGGVALVLDTCPFNAEHRDGAAVVTRAADGRLGFRCHHNSCTGNNWTALRALFEPDYAARGVEGRACATPAMPATTGASAWEHPVAVCSLKAPVEWPVCEPEAFTGLAGDIVRTLEPHTESDPLAMLVQFLAAFGNVIGAGAHFVAEADKHRGNLFAVLVGVSSKGRKGTSWGYIRELFARAVPDWSLNCLKSGLSSGEGVIYHVRDGVSKEKEDKKTGALEVVVEDEGVTDKRLLILETEYAAVLRQTQRDGNTLSATIRNAWDTGTLQSLTKNSPIKATGAHISIIGHITRDELRRELSATETANGFGNRFLWLCVKRSKELPEGGKFHSLDLTDLTGRLSVAIEHAANVTRIERDDEARAIWHAVYGELSAAKPGLLGALTGRSEAQVMRLALLYALLDCDDAIRAQHLTAALALWEYCEASVRNIFGDSLGDRVADEIIRQLRASPEGLSRSEIRDAFGRNKSSDQIGAALKLLESSGMARCGVRKPDSGFKTIEYWTATR